MEGKGKNIRERKRGNGRQRKGNEGRITTKIKEGMEDRERKGGKNMNGRKGD